MEGYLVPARGEPALPLELEQVESAGRDRAQSDVSLELVKQAMSRMAQAEYVQGMSKLAAAEAAWEGLVSSGLLGAESMDKEAFIRGLLSLGRRGAARMAASGGRVGRVGRFLQREVRSPLQISRSGRGAVTARVRSPLGPTPGGAAAATRGGPYRSPGRVSGPAPASRDLVKETMQEGAKSGGLVRGVLKRVALPAAVLGAGYGIYRGGKGLIGMAERQMHMPPAYGYGVRQYQYGFTPSGQAQF